MTKMTSTQRAATRFSVPLRLLLGLFVVGWMPAGSAWGQGLVADLEIQAVGPDGPTWPGGTGRVAFIVTNHGPDRAGEPQPGLTDVVSGSNEIPVIDYIHPEIFFFRAPGSPCSLLWGSPDPPPGGPLVVDFEFRFDALEPGESATCELDFEVTPFIPDGQTSIFTVWNTRVPGTSTTDPNPDNDRVVMIYDLISGPPVVDVPSVSPVGLTLLTVILLGCGLWKHRRLRKATTLCLLLVLGLTEPQAFAQTSLFLEILPPDPDTEPPLGIASIYPVNLDYDLLMAVPDELSISLPDQDPFTAARNLFEPRQGFDAQGIALPGTTHRDLGYLWRGRGEVMRSC